MSEKTWRDRYYPETSYRASEKSNEHMLRHSIKKWWGLRPSALKAHGCYIKQRYLRDSCGSPLSFCIDGSTCALCRVYADNSCSGCPLKNTTDRCRTKYPDLFETGSPYPMIKALIAALKEEIKMKQATLNKD